MVSNVTANAPGAAVSKADRSCQGGAHAETLWALSERETGVTLDVAAAARPAALHGQATSDGSALRRADAALLTSVGARNYM